MKGTMRLFSRKSKWDRLWDAVADTLAEGGDSRLTKVTLGVVGSVVAATAASAAISAVRRSDEK
jgi:hypothetical protein